MQRVSAVYLLLFVLFLLVSLRSHPIGTFSDWRAWVARPGTSIALVFFFAALLGHVWVGLRDVLLDYAKPAALRRRLLAAAALSLLGLGLWMLWILLRLHA